MAFWRRNRASTNLAPPIHTDAKTLAEQKLGPSRVIDLHAESSAYRADGWQNAYTGLGTDRDKAYQGMFFAPYRIPDQELLAMFNGSALVARIVSTRPKEMLRRGYELECEDASPDNIKELTKKAEQLRANALFTEGAMWGNLFGGCLLIIGAQDGKDMSQPLNEKNISTIRYLNLIDRRFAFVRSYYSDPLEANFGLPETYLITSAIGSARGAVVVHESRVIRFDGAETDILTRQQLAGWSWSTMQRVYETIRNFENTYMATGNLVLDASQAVFKIEGLINMIASGEKDALATRMQMVDMSRSVARAVLLDAEKEDFERKPTTFTGLPDVLDRFMMRVSADADIPVTVLFGRSAAGMNATGESDFRNFYGSIESDQAEKLAPKLKRFFKILAAAKDMPTNGTDLDFDIVFKSLWAPTGAEQADIELKTAQKDQIYATIGAASPEEIALSRWGKGAFNGSGMSSFDAKEAKRRQEDEAIMTTIKPPTEEGNAPPPGGLQGVPGALPGGPPDQPAGGPPQAAQTGAGYTLGGAGFVGEDKT